MTEVRRQDQLTARRVEVAIVFKEMLSVEDAAIYMAENGIPAHVAIRVLAGIIKTRVSDAAFEDYCKHDPEVAHTALQPRSPTRAIRPPDSALPVSV
jgi:hypothetical protein